MSNHGAFMIDNIMYTFELNKNILTICTNTKEEYKAEIKESSVLHIIKNVLSGFCQCIDSDVMPVSFSINILDKPELKITTKVIHDGKIIDTCVYCISLQKNTYCPDKMLRDIDDIIAHIKSLNDKLEEMKKCLMCQIDNETT